MAGLTGSLTERGAIVEVTVTVSSARRDALMRTGFPIPAPRSVKAVIDTGSAFTGFHPSLFHSLDLTHIQVCEVLTPTTPHDQPARTRMFDVGIEVGASGGHLVFPSVLAIESLDFDPSCPDQLLGLIGRDLLDRCVFEYDGPARKFSLAVQL